MYATHCDNLCIGKFSGAGVLYYPNGDIYVGDFANDKRQGVGAYTFVNSFRQVPVSSCIGVWSYANNTKYL